MHCIALLCCLASLSNPGCGNDQASFIISGAEFIQLNTDSVKHDSLKSGARDMFEQPIDNEVVEAGDLGNTDHRSNKLSLAYAEPESVVPQVRPSTFSEQKEQESGQKESESVVPQVRPSTFSEQARQGSEPQNQRVNPESQEEDRRANSQYDVLSNKNKACIDWFCKVWQLPQDETINILKEATQIADDCALRYLNGNWLLQKGNEGNIIFVIHSIQKIGDELHIALLPNSSPIVLKNYNLDLITNQDRQPEIQEKDQTQKQTLPNKVHLEIIDWLRDCCKIEGKSDGRYLLHLASDSYPEIIFNQNGTISLFGICNDLINISKSGGLVTLTHDTESKTTNDAMHAFLMISQYYFDGQTFATESDARWATTVKRYCESKKIEFDISKGLKMQNDKILKLIKGSWKIEEGRNSHVVRSITENRGNIEIDYAERRICLSLNEQLP